MSLSTHNIPSTRQLRDGSLLGSGVTAVLGPTNTGKTHYALDRMVAHPTGVIGLPLRLLAREVYGRLVERVGEKHVALITGEEKISPPDARYTVCTVEAMPRTSRASFVAIDEVQLAGDLERGHVFTDRILNLRGANETLLLGADTMAPVLRCLLPGITITARARMSNLSYVGSKKITRLPRRSAIVAFSADEVYAIAELIRRQRGGAAVVMGALSPRTRNAQVQLYQSGEVDYLVATDAIGMGLNLDVDHVAFAQDQKFDGVMHRPLNPAELAQIAGRAGRHVKDGTFGVTSRVAPFDDELVERLQTHQFDPVKRIQWRNRNLSFHSAEDLIASLESPPPNIGNENGFGLTKAKLATDQRALENLLRDVQIKDLCNNSERTKLLWEVCQVPDYRRIAPADHAFVLGRLYVDLMQKGVIGEDWFAEQVNRSDRVDGEIDTLSARIAQIRTWTFLSNKTDWLENSSYWQERTRAIEDALSDALHERLTKRFVDRRTSTLMKRLRENAMLEAKIAENGDVTVEGHHVGQLQGFRFSPDKAGDGPDAKAISAAAAKALAAEIEARAARLVAAANGDFAIGDDATLRWLGQPVGRLKAGDEVLTPQLIVLADEHLTGPSREYVQARLQRFVAFHIETILKPLFDIRNSEKLEGVPKGIAFRLVEELGVLERRSVLSEVRSLEQADRAVMRQLGVRFGAYHIFMPMLLKPAPCTLLCQLWALKNADSTAAGLNEIPQLSASGRTSVVLDTTFDERIYRIAGFRVLGSRAVRVDILERLADLIRPALAWKPQSGEAQTNQEIPEGAFDGNSFVATAAMLSILGATKDDMDHVLKALGYKADVKPAAEVNAILFELFPKLKQEHEERQAKLAEKAAAGDPLEEGEAAQETITVWRQQRAERQFKPNNKTAKSKGGGNKGFKKPKAASSNSSGAQNTKKIDPDSPFAALAGLKDNLGKTR